MRFEPANEKVEADNGKTDKGGVRHDDSAIIDVVRVEGIEKTGKQGGFLIKEFKSNQIKEDGA